METLLQKYLAKKFVHPHQTSKKEVENLQKIVERDLKDASIADLSTDRRFSTAYNAALQLATIVTACSGYRIATRAGHHKITFDLLPEFAGDEVKHWSDYFDICRRKRNMVDYNVSDISSETETEELIRKVKEFQTFVEDWMRTNYPDLLSCSPNP